MTRIMTTSSRLLRIWRVTVMILPMFILVSAQGQAVHKCGYSYVHNQVAARFPEVHKEQKAQPMAKPTADDAAIAVIPVVFHVVLTDAQLKQLVAELIPRYIDSQIAVITRDF